MDKGYCYLNGRIVERESASISVWDAGFLHGASAFTTMRSHNGIVFRLERHLARLGETVVKLGMHVSPTGRELAGAVDAVLDANALSEARVRVTLTPGPVGGDKPTTLVTAEELMPYPAQWYERGITVVISSYKQTRNDPLAGLKTGCYLPRLMGRSEAAGKGSEEAFWFTAEGHLAEACFCNVFLVSGGAVKTPPLDTPVLGGVVREATLELCKDLDIAADDAMPLTIKDLLEAQEVFVTASTSGIRPVARIERHGVADERPGAVTRRLMAAYAELLERECPKGEGK